LQILEAKYPNLVFLSCHELESELKSHFSPLLHFSQDIQTGRIRGIIVADHVDALLAKLLSAKGVL